MRGDSGTPIPGDEASKIYSEIRKEKAVRLFSQCWGLPQILEERIAKMCFSNKPDDHRCNLVNKRYDGLFKT